MKSLTDKKPAKLFRGNTSNVGEIGESERDRQKYYSLGSVDPGHAGRT